MARPRTHGTPISFRLPLDYDELLEQRVKEEGESPAEFVRRIIMKTLDGNRRPPKNGSLARQQVTPIPKTKTVSSTKRKIAH